MVKDFLRSKTATAPSQDVYARLQDGGICPICRMPFDKGKKRKLIDQCGHERCYSCLFKSETCPICALQAPPKKLQHSQSRSSLGPATTTARSKLLTNGTFTSYFKGGGDPGLPPERPSPSRSVSPRRNPHIPEERKKEWVGKLREWKGKEGEEKGDRSK